MLHAVAVCTLCQACTAGSSCVPRGRDAVRLGLPMCSMLWPFAPFRDASSSAHASALHWGPSSISPTPAKEHWLLR